MKKLLLLSLILLGISASAQFPAPYCANTFTGTGGLEPITSVNFAGINNTSPNAIGVAAMQDFTAIIGNVIAGNTYPIILKGNTGGNYLNTYSVYVDWNSDNDFVDAGEKYDIGTIVNSTGLDATQLTSSILVPGNVSAGNKRMRVIKIYSDSATTFPLPCQTGLGYGQSEDYTLSVTVPSCVSPSGGIAVVNVPFLAANLSWTSTVAPCEIVVQLASAPTPSATANTGINVTGTTYSATSLLDETLYEFYVRAECVDGTTYSAWAGPFAFNTFLPPTCTTEITPLNGATGIPSRLNITQLANPATFSWNALPEATSYDFYYGVSTTGSASIFLGNYTAATASIVLTGYNALFYWKIVPVGPGGPATGCPDWTFTTQLNPTLATGTISNSSFSISPNPANDFVTISSKNNTISNIEMTDINGRVVKTVKAGNINEANINISELSSGVYMTKITSENGISTKKIIKN